MLEPAIGVRREIGVLAENLLRAHVLLQLGQKTLSADVDVERIKRFHLIRFLRTYIAFAERRHTEVDKGVTELRPAEPAACLRRNHLLLLHENAPVTLTNNVRPKYISADSPGKF